jgi:hypothetical protein
MPCVFDIAHDFAQIFYPADIQMPGRMGKGRGADFYYDTHKIPPK